MSQYYLGCPVWSCPQWRGSVYRAKAPKDRWLNHYSQSFKTVEGNSTFYGIPKLEIFERWAKQTEPGFQFALKFPRLISHDKLMQNVELESDLFLKGLEILHQHDRLGPSFLQLSPSFSPSQFGLLANYLNRLPDRFPYAVEVRHPGWFEGEAERRLNDLLRNQNVDRVIFDSRPLYSAPPTDEFEAKSQQRKPKVPIRTEVTGQRPMLRFIGRNDVSLTQEWIEEWVPVVAQWMNEGLIPFVFTHTPDDQFAPQFAKRFHNALAEVVDGVDPIVEWPFQTPQQKELF